MPNIPVSTTRNYYQDSLHVTIRRDFDRATDWAFIAAPNYFCADAEQLRHLADAFHDMADQLEGEAA